jgi:hypothetical protein
VSAQDGKPYFTIDGVQLSDDGGEVVYREYRKTSLGDNIQANGGLFYTFEEHP